MSTETRYVICAPALISLDELEALLAPESAQKMNRITIKAKGSNLTECLREVRPYIDGMIAVATCSMVEVTVDRVRELVAAGRPMAAREMLARELAEALKGMEE